MDLSVITGNPILAVAGVLGVLVIVVAAMWYFRVGPFS